MYVVIALEMSTVTVVAEMKGKPLKRSIGTKNEHLYERFFWIFVTIISICGAVNIAYSNLNRYVANPTVVSIQKDYRNWKNPFPAVSGCFVRRVDKKKAENYILRKWGRSSSDPLFDHYLKFIETVANVSYSNLYQFSVFENDSSLKGVDMLEVAAEVHPKLSGTLVTFDIKHQTNWTLVMSEIGICFSVNSKFSAILAVQKSVHQRPQTTLRCHYLNGLCYARYDSDPQLPLNYYVHSPLDVVHATSDLPLIVEDSEELEINYHMLETESAPSTRYLSPQQRKCRFYDEPLTPDFPFFSTSICYITCRYHLAIKLCKCRPFFYHTLKGKVCNISGLICLSKHYEYITSSPVKLGCRCPEPCDIITYLPLVPKLTKWEYGYFDQRITFRWGLLPPNTKYYRNVLFGFEDLVVSFGGTLSLFLGISFMSVLELIFLAIEYVIKLVKKRKELQEKL